MLSRGIAALPDGVRSMTETDLTDRTLSTVAGLLRDARRALFVTGAGISADSGLPTYRGIGGLYESGETEDGLPIEVALSGDVFAVRPDLSWKHIWRIGAACRDATYNRAHEVIALIEQRASRTWVLTQNIDGYHRAAGSRNVIEIHGRASDLYCLGCGDRFGAEAFIDASGKPVELPPRCPRCRGLVRPDVVLFGELLPEPAVAQLVAIMDDRDLVVSVGTSSLFPYVMAPVLRARSAGVPTVEINPGRTEVSDVVDHRIVAGAAETMDRLWELMR